MMEVSGAGRRTRVVGEEEMVALVVLCVLWDVRDEDVVVEVMGLVRIELYCASLDTRL